MSLLVSLSASLPAGEDEVNGHKTLVQRLDTALKEDLLVRCASAYIHVLKARPV